MATEITMPQLGESVTEGTISKWLVNPGDKVNKYDPIAEVMTDKVNAEIPSSYSGTIKELLVKEDEIVPVGQAICLIETTEQKSKEKQVEENSGNITNAQVKTENKDSQSARFSPAVLRLAQENKISLNQLSGSGRGGRITRKDILTLLGDKGQEAPSLPEKQSELETFEKKENHRKDNLENTTQTQNPAAKGDVEIPVTGVRKAIASNMVKSMQEAPHAWTMVEVDVTNLVALRNEVKESFKQREGFNLTFLPFFMKAVVESLKEYPELNSLWGGDKIIRKKDVHLSVAVATDDALYVPVIKHADEKTIKGLARELQEISGKVRAGKMSPSDMQGGTFTINNTGSFGSILSKPIINHPQAAILSVESIVKRPVIVNDMIAVRSMVNLCLSLDHRMLDGLVCGRFLANVKKRLEQVNKENVALY